MFQGIMIIVFFLIIAVLMIMKKIPTLVALPVLAVGVCLISGVPFNRVDAATGQPTGFFQTVFEAGAVRMANAYIAVVFGAWLGQIMNKTGVTETMIKKSAELGGDRPLVVTLILSAAVAILFTTLSGLGSIIMVGTIVLPILVSVGVPAISASCIFLLAFATGLCFNVSNWQTYMSLLGIGLEPIKRFEIILFGVTAFITIIFILIEFKKNGVKFAFSAPVNDMDSSRPQIKGFCGLMAMISPLIPIVLVAFLKIPIITSFVFGIVWIAVFTSKGFAKTMNLITKTCYDGITDSAPAIILMIGIGMLYLAVTDPVVKAVLEPFMKAIVPSGGLPYILFFVILAPLSLYRGPLNMFGLGSGVAALMAGLGIMPNQAVMGAFLSVERIQGCGDPTNTQNVWTANFAEVDVNAITKKIILYLWFIAAVGIVCSNFMFFK